MNILGIVVFNWWYNKSPFFYSSGLIHVVLIWGFIIQGVVEEQFWCAIIHRNRKPVWFCNVICQGCFQIYIRENSSWHTGSVTLITLFKPIVKVTDFIVNTKFSYETLDGAGWQVLTQFDIIASLFTWHSWLVSFHINSQWACFSIFKYLASAWCCSCSAPSDTAATLELYIWYRLMFNKNIFVFFIFILNIPKHVNYLYREISRFSNMFM